MDKKLVEEWLPLSEINLHAAVEISFRIARNKYRSQFLDLYGTNPSVFNVGTPQPNNLHPWFARRPIALSRILNLAAVLPCNIDKDTFRRIVGFNYISNLATQKILPILLNVDPERGLLNDVFKKYEKNSSEITIVDPMAGGGSIPLEALRLGFRTVAMEYNPVAYLILKATLEYPAKYGVKLYEEVRAEAERLICWARGELGKYYPEDAMNYVIARGYRCRSCGGLIPIIHTTRLGKNGPYIKFSFDKDRKSFMVDISNVETEFERLRCPYCRSPVVKDIALREWVSRHKRLLRVALNGDFKSAKESVEELNQTHILLVKQTGRGFKATGKEDVEKFTEAYLDLARLSGELKEYIPSDPIARRENEVFKPITDLEVEYWYELFNPRQLLILSELIKYVRVRAEELIKEKGEFGATIALYLSFGVNKLANFNNITTTWDDSTKTIRELLDHYARTRKIGFGLEYCEAKRIDQALNWVFEPDVEEPTKTHGGICPVVKYLCSWLDGLGDRVRVFMADAMVLSKVLGGKSVDVINVDPPYFDQHTYSDISEFFWQILRITLSPAIDVGYLFSRGESSRAELFVSGWSPILSTVPRDNEVIERKTVKVSVKGRSALEILERMKTPHSRDWYVKNMWIFFREVYKSLKDDGVLIVWFTHSDPEAWEGILSALYASGFIITKVWTIRTEMAERRVALAGSAFFSSLAIVARKAGERVVVGTRSIRDLSMNEDVKQAIMSSAVDALQSAIESGASEHEKYIMALAGAIAGATRIWNPSIEAVSVKRGVRPIDEFARTESLDVEDVYRFVVMLQFFRESLYPVALYHGVSRILEGTLKEAFTKAGVEKTLAENMVNDILLVDNDSKAFLLLWMSTRFSEESTVEYDFGEKICKVIGTSLDRLKNLGLLETKGGTTRKIIYGREAVDLIKRRVEILDKTVSGMALRLTKILADTPAVEETSRAAERVKTLFPFSRQVVAVALFLLLTAREDELEPFGITRLNKPFIENVLKLLYGR
ncbi:MAG: hypothetical protein QXX41_01835 [Nitrososphaerota archaeon]